MAAQTFRIGGALVILSVFLGEKGFWLMMIALLGAGAYPGSLFLHFVCKAQKLVGRFKVQYGKMFHMKQDFSADKTAPRMLPVKNSLRFSDTLECKTRKKSNHKEIENV